jgi:hypothetical protein
MAYSASSTGLLSFSFTQSDEPSFHSTHTSQPLVVCLLATSHSWIGSALFSSGFPFRPFDGPTLLSASYTPCVRRQPCHIYFLPFYSQRIGLWFHPRRRFRTETCRVGIRSTNKVPVIITSPSFNSSLPLALDSKIHAEPCSYEFVVCVRLNRVDFHNLLAIVHVAILGVHRSILSISVRLLVQSVLNSCPRKYRRVWSPLARLGSHDPCRQAFSNGLIELIDLTSVSSISALVTCWTVVLDTTLPLSVIFQ